MKTCNMMWALSIITIFTLSACQNSQTTKTLPVDNFEDVYNQINTQDLKTHIKTLASDEYEGRLPTTIGEQKTLDYLVSEFKALGYQPGNGESYL
ncbi:MAG: peptidase M28, partial [Paraglaciecola sp.]